MRIAIEGCAHGELERIYDTLKDIEIRENIKVDLLLCCGDFQSTRNKSDLLTMAVPQKYMTMSTFYKYYNGECVAPILTIFIGGNHEASNYLQELPYGGWVAPNIYYLGYSGVVSVNGIRIGGLSGIFKKHDFSKGRFEFSPYSERTRRSVYHTRNLDVFRLEQMSGPLDIFLSHDWPRGIYNYGNKEQLLRFKPHFQNEIENNVLGSEPCEKLLKVLKPAFWFAAHLHCKFSAVVPHYQDVTKLNKNSTNVKYTKFLALDKCLPKRRYLQILEIQPRYMSDTVKFEYDLEWLTILHLTNHLINVREAELYIPSKTSKSEERHNFTPTTEELNIVRNKFKNNLNIPHNFCRTAEVHDVLDPMSVDNINQPKCRLNPQTEFFCDILEIDDPLKLLMLIKGNDNPNYFEKFTKKFDPEVESLCAPASNLQEESSGFEIEDIFGSATTNIQQLSPGESKSVTKLQENTSNLENGNVFESNPSKNVLVTASFKRRNQNIYGQTLDKL